MFSRPNFLNFGAKSAAILLMDFIGVARVKAIEYFYYLNIKLLILKPRCFGGVLRLCFIFIFYFHLSEFVRYLFLSRQFFIFK